MKRFLSASFMEGFQLYFAGGHRPMGIKCYCAPV
jgi:hypothetical protein